MELISKEDAMRQFKILCVEQCLHARQQECGQCLLAVASDAINNLPVKEKSGEITFEQFREYCEKRNFVVVAKEFFPGTQIIQKAEVVRCKECAHWDRSWYTSDGNHFCSMIDKATKGDWFCADGEKESKWN